MQVARFHRWLFVGVLAAAAGVVRGQECDSLLMRLNRLYSGQAVFRLAPDARLVVDIRDATGRCRQEQVQLRGLDPSSISFRLEGDAICAACTASAHSCIRREEFRQGSVIRTSRLSIQRPVGDPAGGAVIEALRLLVVSACADLADARATQPAAQRMNGSPIQPQP